LLCGECGFRAPFVVPSSNYDFAALFVSDSSGFDMMNRRSKLGTSGTKELYFRNITAVEYNAPCSVTSAGERFAYHAALDPVFIAAVVRDAGFSRIVYRYLSSGDFAFPRLSLHPQSLQCVPDRANILVGAGDYGRATSAGEVMVLECQTRGSVEGLQCSKPRPSLRHPAGSVARLRARTPW